MTIQMAPRSLLTVFFRHWRVALFVFILILAVGICYAYLTPPQYRSEAAVLVKFGNYSGQGRTAIPNIDIPAQQAERTEVVNTSVQILLSQDLILETLRQIDLFKLYPSLANPSKGSPISSTELPVIEQARMKFVHDLDVKAEREANVITVSLCNSNPEIAASTLTKLLELFVERQTKLYSASLSVFMREQVEEARQRATKSQQAFDNFAMTYGISSIEDERAGLLRLQTDTRGLLEQQRSRIAEAESRYASVAASLAGIKPVIELSDENDRVRAVDDARTRLADLIARRAELSNYRSDSLSLQTLYAQIASAKRELAARSNESEARIRTGPSPAHQQVQLDLLHAEADLQAAKAGALPHEQQLRSIEDRLAELNAKQGEYHTLLLQRDADEESSRNFLQRVDDARVTDAAHRQDVNSVALIQSPTIPVRPISPRSRLIVALSLLLGITMVFVICFVIEAMDETFSRPDQVLLVTGLPVLGVFPVIERGVQDRLEARRPG